MFVSTVNFSVNTLTESYWTFRGDFYQSKGHILQCEANNIQNIEKAHLHDPQFR